MNKVIKRFNIDFSDLPAVSESREFTIIGDIGAEFKLEVKDKDTGKYYNFITNSFQTTATSLEKKLDSKKYTGNIVFPAVTGTDDQYDFYIWAKPGTEHAEYEEVRFIDGSINLNRSVGSNSLLMQKVIYQYDAITLSINSTSPNSTIAGTLSTAVISNTLGVGKSLAKQSFSITATAASDKSYKIVKQPTTDDILSFVTLTVDASPTTIDGENIYPTVTTAADATSEGGTTVNGASSGTTVTCHVSPNTFCSVGDRVFGNAVLAAKVHTVTEVSAGSGKTFEISNAVTIADDLPLSFSNQMNYQWGVSDVNKVQYGMIVAPGSSTHVTANSSISNYEDVITLFEGTDKEEKIIQKLKPFKSVIGAATATVTKGKVTTEPGSVIFDKQQKIKLGGQTVRIGGYGQSEILRIHGYDVEITNLKIELTPITTTTTAAVNSSTTVPVLLQNGILAGDVATVSGIGIDPTAAAPTVSSRDAATNAGNLTLSAAQTLESGATLTFAGCGQVATITGDIKVLKAGDADVTIGFDIEKLLTIH